MRTKTQKEKEFNACAKTYGVRAFTAKEFDKDKELQKAFNNFQSIIYFGSKPLRKFKLLRLYNLKFSSRIDIYYGTFLENYKKNNSSNNDYSTIVVSTQKLFELHTPIEAIACYEYFDAYILTQGYPTSYDSKETQEIIHNVQKWHKVRKEIDNIKPFIRQRFPQWEKATKQEKLKIKKDIETLINDLTTLRMDTRKINQVYDFINNYTGLNQLSKYKIDVLLSLKLPLIDSPKIAKKILENSSS